MPTVHRWNGYRFFFFSNENEEPPHIHVEKGEGYAKFWLQPDVELAWSRRFRKKDLTAIAAEIAENQEEFLEAWDEFFEGRLRRCRAAVRVTETFLRVTLYAMARRSPLR